MKILLAPDSFKGNLRSPQICAALSRGIRQELPTAEIISLPMADGGEGTTEAVVNAWGGSFHRVQVSGPLGEPVEAVYGVSADGKTAVMEMASASGIELLSTDQLNPLLTSTCGTGELLKAILDAGIRDIIMGIGGSATVDGGIGMAQALGFDILNPKGQPVSRGGESLQAISAIKSDRVHPALQQMRLRVACDVTSPLLGPAGAATVFGPQKGATPEMVDELEKGLINLRSLIHSSSPSLADVPGDGAAGGLGFGLRAFCDAEIVSGADLVAEAVGLENYLPGADLLITGEGQTDEQTLNGKLCAVVAGLAKQHGVSTVLLSGAIAGDIEQLLDLFDSVFSITTGPVSLQECLRNAERNLTFTVRSVIRALR